MTGYKVISWGVMGKEMSHCSLKIGFHIVFVHMTNFDLQIFCNSLRLRHKKQHNEAQTLQKKRILHFYKRVATCFSYRFLLRKTFPYFVSKSKS